MKKKDRKKIEKLIKKESKKLRNAIVSEACSTRVQVRTVSKDLSYSNRMIVGNVNSLKHLIDTMRCSEQRPNNISGEVAELKEFPPIKLRKKERKKILDILARDFREYVDGELVQMCEALVNHCEKEIYNMKSAPKCPHRDGIPATSITKVGGLEDFEKFCENILGVPPEIILGPNYKEEYGSSEKKKESEEKKNDGTESDQADNTAKEKPQIYDCGTKNLVAVSITDEETLRKLEGKYYRENEEEPLKVIEFEKDKGLIGRTIMIRSSLTCECENGEVCMVCEGFSPKVSEKISEPDDIGDAEIDDDLADVDPCPDKEEDDDMLRDHDRFTDDDDEDE